MALNNCIELLKKNHKCYIILQHQFKLQMLFYNCIQYTVPFFKKIIKNISNGIFIMHDHVGPVG